MKKILSFLLATVLIFAMAVPAFAAEEVTDVTSGTGSGSADQEVTATYDPLVDDTDVDTVYFVTVTWEVDSELVYHKGTQTYTWKVDDTKYVANEIEDDGWEGEASVTITVTNSSNADVTAKASWEAEGDIEATCEFDDDEIVIESAAKDIEVITDGADGDPVSGTISGTVTVAEDSVGITEDDATVGTVTVAIEPAE